MKTLEQQKRYVNSSVFVDFLVTIYFGTCRKKQKSKLNEKNVYCECTAGVLPGHHLPLFITTGIPQIARFLGES